MENREIARILSETADLMEIGAEDSFRIRSYRNAAATIESYPERVADIMANQLGFKDDGIALTDRYQSDTARVIALIEGRAQRTQ